MIHELMQIFYQYKARLLVQTPKSQVQQRFSHEVQLSFIKNLILWQRGFVLKTMNLTICSSAHKSPRITLENLMYSCVNTRKKPALIKRSLTVEKIQDQYFWEQLEQFLFKVRRNSILIRQLNSCFVLWQRSQRFLAKYDATKRW